MTVAQSFEFIQYLTCANMVHCLIIYITIF